MIRFLLAALLVIFGTLHMAHAQTQQASAPWVIEEIRDGSVPFSIVPDRRAIAPNSMPDARITTGEGDIREAWYTEPTGRYAHAVLGDGIEAGALKVKNNHGETFTFRLPRTEVFEDIAPRLADLDRDGRTEVITILSSQHGGGSVAVFHLNGNALVKIAQTPFIGTPNRWLNIAEIDNFGGGRRPDIAIVVTPHLAGILQFYRFRNGKLVRISRAPGFSNHFIGSNELRLSTVADVNGNGIPDLILPSLARNELVMVGIQGQNFAQLGRVRLPARINRAIGQRTRNGRSEFVVGLDNGRIYAVRRP